MKITVIGNDTSRGERSNRIQMTHETVFLLLGWNNQLLPRGMLASRKCLHWLERKSCSRRGDPWPMFRLGEIENRLEINGSSDGGCQIFTRRARHFHKGESSFLRAGGFLLLPDPLPSIGETEFSSRINLEGFGASEISKAFRSNFPLISIAVSQSIS